MTPEEEEYDDEKTSGKPELADKGCEDEKAFLIIYRVCNRIAHSQTDAGNTAHLYRLSRSQERLAVQSSVRNGHDRCHGRSQKLGEYGQEDNGSSGHCGK